MFTIPNSILSSILVLFKQMFVLTDLNKIQVKSSKLFVLFELFWKPSWVLVDLNPIQVMSSALQVLFELFWKPSSAK